MLLETRKYLTQGYSHGYKHKYERIFYDVIITIHMTSKIVCLVT